MLLFLKKSNFPFISSLVRPHGEADEVLVLHGGGALHGAVAGAERVWKRRKYIIIKNNFLWNEIYGLGLETVNRLN